MPTYNRIVKDATSYKKDFGSTTSTSWNHTVGSTGEDRILIVAVANRGGPTAPSSITFNGDALTKVIQSTAYDGCDTSQWYLLNPDTGTHSIAVSWGYSCDSNIVLGAISFFNVDQSSPFDNTRQSAANASGFTITESIARDYGAYVVAQFNTGNTVGSISYGGTQIVGKASNDSGAVGYEQNLASGNQSCGYSSFATGTTAYSASAVYIQPSAGRQISKSEAITISESVLLHPDLQVDVSEALTISEYIDPYLEVKITESESVSLTESYDQTVRTGLSISIWKEKVRVSEYIDWPGPRDLQHITEPAISVSEHVQVKIQDETNESYKPSFNVEY